MLFDIAHQSRIPIGEDVELNGAAELLVQIHDALDPEHQEHIVLDIGMTVEKPAFGANAHRIQPQADITQGLLGVEGLPFRIIAMVFLNAQLIKVGQDGIVLWFQFGEVRLLRQPEILV